MLERTLVDYSWLIIVFLRFEKENIYITSRFGQIKAEINNLYPLVMSK